MMSEKSKSNPLWHHVTEPTAIHVTEPTAGKARCNVCNKLVSLGAEHGEKKNVTNLWVT